MKRRTLLRNMVIISAGTVLLPACRTDKTVAGLKNISLKESQLEMLSQLSETILPSTPKFIGAKELKSHEFLLRMVDDCTSPEDQKKFTDGLKAFEEACDKKNEYVVCKKHTGATHRITKRTGSQQRQKRFSCTIL